jgi:succinyl-CoA synthetase beta subunit
MHIHEYQAKQLLAEYQIPIPKGGVASTVDEAAKIAREIGGSGWMVKAQIHAGGRRAGHFEDAPQGEGGVRNAKSVTDVEKHAGQMLGNALITTQTRPSGSDVERVYVEQACDVQSELYLGMLVDRHSGRVTLIASAAGGVYIESIAEQHPESIIKFAIDPLNGLGEEAAQSVVSQLALGEEQASVATRVIQTMYEMFVELDASLIEINPMAITTAGEVIALDATLTFDDNALFRHQDIQALRDEAELDLGELEAVRHGINYVKLDGNIGCLASGAGTALATVDAIQLLGGEPANFLDVTPVAQVERVKEALKLLLSDPGVASILVNVFGGGIMRCDTIADAIIMANRDAPLKVPLVARLAGTNATFAIRRLKDAGPEIIFASDLADAADKAVKAGKQTKKIQRRSWWRRVRGVSG